MSNHEPSWRAQELGRSLRNIMSSARVNGRQVAAQLGWPPNQVSRLLTGRRPAREADVAAFLTVCGMTTESERDRLLELCRPTTRPYPERSLPRDLAAYLHWESMASGVYQYACLTVPDLLATVDYLHAVLAASATVSTEDKHWRLVSTLGRTSLFTREDPPIFEFILHEWILRTPIGGPAVLTGQLWHLLRLARRPGVSVRVVPIACGAHPGLGGPFTLLEFPNTPSMLYQPAEESGRFLDRPDQIDRYRKVLAGVQAVALPEGESLELVSAVLAEFTDADTTAHDQPRQIQTGRERSSKSRMVSPNHLMSGSTS